MTDKFDNYLDYSIVVESATEPNAGFELIDDGKKNGDGLSYLKFRACLQTFNNRNRNRRLWLSKWMKPMINAPEVKELIREGGVPGEAGHPIPITGEVTMERILTIDPDNVSHIVKEFIWVGENQLDGIIETADDGNGPGDKFRRNILQGFPVSFSTRSVIPQRKLMDGSSDQTGPGRYVCSDRVYLPSHKEAYIDKTIPVKKICKKDHFETVMESFASYVVDNSRKVDHIIENMYPALESATIDRTGTLSIKTEQGVALIRPENRFRSEFADVLRSL